MSMSKAAQQALAKLLFQNTAWANVGSAGGLQPSSAAGSYYIALHTGNPGDAGDQTTNEAAYTGYARVAVARSSGGFTVANTDPTQITNAAAVTFGAPTGGDEVELYFSIGLAASGPSQIVAYGALSVAIPAANGLAAPSFAAGQLMTTVGS